MDDETDDRLHVVQDLFALITSLCEDAAGLALDGQGCSNADVIDRLAASLCEAGQRIMIVAGAVLACGSAWKRDPGSGVIGVEKGPLIPVV